MVREVGVVTSQAFPSGLVCSHNGTGWYLAFCDSVASCICIFTEILQRILQRSGFFFSDVSSFMVFPVDSFL